MPASLYVHCVYAGTCRSQKSVVQALELRLQAVVHHPVWVLATDAGFLQKKEVHLTAISLTLQFWFQKIFYYENFWACRKPECNHPISTIMMFGLFSLGFFFFSPLVSFVYLFFYYTIWIKYWCNFTSDFLSHSINAIRAISHCLCFCFPKIQLSMVNHVLNL